MVLEIEKSEWIVLTNKVTNIKGKHFIEIPKEIYEIMEIDENSLIEAIICKVENKKKVDYEKLIGENNQFNG